MGSRKKRPIAAAMAAIPGFEQASHDDGAKEVATWALAAERRRLFALLRHCSRASAAHLTAHRPLTAAAANAPPPSARQNTNHSVVEDSCDIKADMQSR